MKKVLFVLLLSLLIISCATVKERPNFSEKEASYALSFAMDKALSKAFSKTNTYLQTKESFIPKGYEILYNERSNIAGLNTMLENWASYASLYVLSSGENFESYVCSLAENFTFEDPSKTVFEGDSSASETFFAKNGKAILIYMKNNLSEMDTSLLEKAINQYNLWARANNLLEGSIIEELSMPDIRLEVASLVYAHFKDYMILSEELFRTTPSADSDPVVAKVFNLE